MFSRKNREYTPLTSHSVNRSGFRVAPLRSRLWLAKDHILKVESSGYRESYVRLYLKDIQAIIISGTARYDIYNYILYVLTGITLLFAMLGYFQGEGFLTTVSLWLTALFGVGIIANRIMGPSCRMIIHTAVSAESVAGIDRVRGAKKLIARLRPLIEDAQGELSAEDIVTLSSVAASPPTGRKALRSRSPKVEAPVESAPYDGRFHLMLSAALLLDAAVTSMQIFFNQLWLQVAALIVMLGVCTLCIFSLIRQQGQEVPRMMRITGWSALAYLCVSFVLGYVVYLFAMFREPELMLSKAGAFQALATLPVLEIPFLLGIYVFSVVCAVLIGASGLLAYREFLHEVKARQYIESLTRSAGV